MESSSTSSASDFDFVALSEQRALNGSVILRAPAFQAPPRRNVRIRNDRLLFIRHSGLAKVAYFVALASKRPLPMPRSSYLHDGAHIAGLHAARKAAEPKRHRSAAGAGSNVAEQEAVHAALQSQLFEDRVQGLLSKRSPIAFNSEFADLESERHRSR